MNLRPPPVNGNVVELEKWCRDLFAFLQFPDFEVIKLVPRSSSPSAQKGVTYYDSDDDKAKTHNGTDYQDLY